MIMDPYAYPHHKNDGIIVGRHSQLWGDFDIVEWAWVCWWGGVFERTNKNKVVNGLEEVSKDFTLTNMDSVDNELQTNKWQQFFCWAKCKQTRSVSTGNKQTNQEIFFDEEGVVKEGSRAIWANEMLLCGVTESKSSDKLYNDISRELILSTIK